MSRLKAEENSQISLTDTEICKTPSRCPAKNASGKQQYSLCFKLFLSEFVLQAGGGGPPYHDKCVEGNSWELGFSIRVLGVQLRLSGWAAGTFSSWRIHLSRSAIAPSQFFPGSFNHSSLNALDLITPVSNAQGRLHPAWQKWGNSRAGGPL